MRATLLIVMMLFASAPAMSNDLPDGLPPDLHAIAQLTLSDPDIAEMAATCPSQLWADHSLSPASFLLGDCRSPTECQQHCVQGVGAACFDLALGFQDMKPEMPVAVSERLFAQSCASGYAGGCTNRAAGLLSREVDDPFTSRPLEDAKVCAAKTFEITCNMDDAWGCTMHALNLLSGTLGPEDRPAAEKAARKACALDPDDSVGACSYARAVMQH